MKFGEKVRDLRKKHSLTQDELAQCLGINKRTIIGWERDGRYPRSIEMLDEYYGAAEPPVRCGESHLSGLTEPPHFVY